MRTRCSLHIDKSNLLKAPTLVISRTKHVAGGNLQTSMSGSCAVCVDGVLYLFGGHHARGNTNSVRLLCLLMCNLFSVASPGRLRCCLQYCYGNFCTLLCRSTGSPSGPPALFGRKWRIFEGFLLLARTSWAAGFTRTGEAPRSFLLPLIPALRKQAC